MSTLTWVGPCARCDTPIDVLPAPGGRGRALDRRRGLRDRDAVDAAGRTASVSAVQPSQPAAPSPTACPETPAVAPNLPWWQERVFYEVFVRSFADSDGDGIGDLRGLTERLDYLNDGDPATTDDLGVTGLWLMPDRRVAQLPRLRRRRLPGHRSATTARPTTSGRSSRPPTSAASRSSPTSSSTTPRASIPGSRTRGRRARRTTTGTSGPTSIPGIARSDGSRVWHADGDRFYYGYFWEGMPDLNLENPEVTAELGADRRLLARGHGRRRLPDRCRAPPDRGRPASSRTRTRRSTGWPTSGPPARRPGPRRSSSARSGTPRRCRRSTSATARST